MPPEQAKELFQKMHEAVEHPEDETRIKKEVAELAKKAKHESEPRLSRLIEWERKKEAKE